jgi:hypothetical protein
MGKADHINLSASALLFTLVLCGCSPSIKTVPVSGNVSTVADGLPFAAQIKDSMVKEAHLTTILVDLVQDADHLKVQEITYGFASTKNSGRLLGIVVNNVTRQAYALLDAPEIPKNPLIPATAFQPLDLSNVSKEISDVLEIARTNGLAEFCALAPGDKGNISLSLGNAEAGIVWGVSGDAWDEKGPIAVLSIVIEAKTGNVLSHTLQKGVGR